jgi:hypothetical protein
MLRYPIPQDMQALICARKMPTPHHITCKHKPITFHDKDGLPCTQKRKQCRPQIFHDTEHSYRGPLRYNTEHYGKWVTGFGVKYSFSLQGVTLLSARRWLHSMRNADKYLPYFMAYPKRSQHKTIC